MNFAPPLMHWELCPFPVLPNTTGTLSGGHILKRPRAVAKTTTRNRIPTPTKMVRCSWFFGFDEQVRSIKLYDGYRFPCEIGCFPGYGGERLQAGVEGHLDHAALFGVVLV